MYESIPTAKEAQSRSNTGVEKVTDKLERRISLAIKKSNKSGYFFATIPYKDDEEMVIDMFADTLSDEPFKYYTKIDIVKKTLFLEW